MTPAERKRRQRERERAGLRVVEVVVREDDLEEALRAAGLLPHYLEGNRDAFDAACSEVLQQWSRDILSRVTSRDDKSA
jgi:hypothetical protein